MSQAAARPAEAETHEGGLTAAAAGSPPGAPLDAVSLSALIASRLCHDLVNPVGALGSGLEVLEDQGMDDAMRAAAIELIKTGGKKSVALLKYARLAYGAAGGRGAQIPMEEAAATLQELYLWSKAELEWALPAGHAAKEIVKTLMILAYCAADCVPRGDVVRVTGEAGLYRVEARGAKALLQDDLIAALAGECADIKPKFAPAYVAGLLARETGGFARAYRVDMETVVLEAQFGAR